jgi:hypothetical protein
VLFQSILFSFCVFLCFIGLWKKRRHFWKYGLKEQNWEKAKVSAKAINHKGLAIECISPRVPKTRDQHTCAHTHKKRIDRSAIKRTRSAIECTCT